MKSIMGSAVRQAIIMSVIVVAVGLVFNAVRKDGIPIIAEAGTFKVETDAEFMKVDDARLLFKAGTAVFVDARAPRVFAAERIEGAVNVPPSGPGLEDSGWLTDIDADVVCYASEAGQRQAGVVANRLLEMGAERVFLLYGGIEAWKAAGLPTETD
jgi:rhodanese-related sulfurtransferase